MFNQDLIRLKPVVKRLPLLQEPDDITLAEQRRDLLLRTMVSPAVYMDDEEFTLCY